ncbi:hypothetical protein ACYZTR_00885 [Pseudomonas sp. Hz4]
MLLRIQQNETIRSFIERNIFILGETRFPKWNASKSLTSEDVRNVASVLGWHGCYGFNRLLHSHTCQPLHSVLKNSQDMAYSGSKYIAEFVDVDPAFPKRLSFCPECVKSDFEKIGFSYWRRASLEFVGVCAIHNVMLESVCPACDRPFTFKGHSHNVMWEGCGGKYLSESSSRVNNDLAQLKRSRLIDDLYKYRFHISLIPTLEALSIRFLSVSSKTLSDAFNQEELQKLSRVIITLLARVKIHAESNLAFYFESVDFNSIINSITMLYDEFQEFVADVIDPCDQQRDITSLWSTYRAGGHESGHYVDENYSLGVGNWYCPYPSPLSLGLGRGDFVRQSISTSYPCCSFVGVKKGRVKRAQNLADPPHPAIPCVEAMQAYG